MGCHIITELDVQGAFTIVTDEDDNGKRLDLYVTSRIESGQRTRVSDLISEGLILVNGKPKKPAYKVKPGDTVSGVIPPQEPVCFEPENIQLDILFEDNDIIVLNKQPDLVVHPAPGHWTGTLVNGLLFHFPGIGCDEHDSRPGIVHRLDRDTSGVMIVAKNQKTLKCLAESFHSRTVRKEYIAVVHGCVMVNHGVISLPVGRHPVDRKKMSTVSSKGRHAETHFSVEKRFNAATLLRCVIKTGRTHQIRVHCQSMNHPVVGDAVYTAGKRGVKKHVTHEEVKLLNSVKRQMLHSNLLEIKHPATLEIMTFIAPIPDDMAVLIEKLHHFSEPSF